MPSTLGGGIQTQAGMCPSTLGWAPSADCDRAPRIHHLVHEICDEQTERVYYDVGLLQFAYESL